MNNLYFISLFFCLYAFIETDKQKGIASYYGNSMHGRRTYSGEKYNKDSLTAAHRTLPMGTKVKVTNLKNDSVVVVRINDKMGTSKRIIDLSMAAAKKLNFVRAGLTTVSIEKIDE
jgi:rare lipoprotein A